MSQQLMNAALTVSYYLNILVSYQRQINLIDFLTHCRNSNKQLYAR